MTGLHSLIAFTDRGKIGLADTFGTALVVDVARQYMCLLERKWCMWTGGEGGEEGGGVGGHGWSFVLLLPGMGEVHGVRNRTIIDWK